MEQHNLYIIEGTIERYINFVNQRDKHLQPVFFFSNNKMLFLFY